MSYSQHVRKEWQNRNGLQIQVDVPQWELDPVEPDVEALAAKLYDVTHCRNGGLMVPFSGQPDDIRDYHHDLARTTLGRPSEKSIKPQDL